MEGVSYKVRVGPLMYTMMGTRADLAFVVSIVSQFMLKASPLHWMAMKRIMRNLKETLDFNCLEGKAISFEKKITMRIGHEIQMNGYPPLGKYFLPALELFCGNAEDNQTLHYLRWR
jgi:hypothetical protein